MPVAFSIARSRRPLGGIIPFPADVRDRALAMIEG
jgi:hypothetical protein